MDQPLTPALIVTALVCGSCNHAVFSRCRHDMRWCKCKSVAIDGGFDYCRVIAKAGTGNVQLAISVSKRDLYDDWNKRINKHGLYSPDEWAALVVPPGT